MMVIAHISQKAFAYFSDCQQFRRDLHDTKHPQRSWRGAVLRTDSVNSIPQSNADSTQNVNIVMPSDSKNTIHNSNQNIPHSNSAGSQPPEPALEDEEEGDKPLDLSWPDTWQKG
ncbi:hypothetical protein CEXT_797851 [Caerostris extrusa]|uniref:Uncharacterized protein n=1 Tax=Caerostris extrusa TaxID=172846 RepID=A0AAV4SLU7_CAEEX|nr:hypothetical protein CEXT_797851 [Caerostris extrusa]